MNKEKYIKARKQQLKELMQLVFQRSETNKAIRKLNKSMHEWDTVLLNEGR